MALVLGTEPHWVSPWVFACFVALKEKRLAFDVRVFDASKGETRNDEYLAQTVTGRVPSFFHDDFALAESSAIVEYLEDTFPAVPVLPTATRERARARQLMSWLRSDETLPIRKERPTTTMFFESERAKAPLSDEARRAADKLCAVSLRVRGAFDRWNIVHSELAFVLHRLILNGDALPDELRAWAAEEWKRPSVHEFVARERKI